MKTAALLTAAGSGMRMNCAIKKPYIMLQGKPLVAYALGELAVSPGIGQIVITVSPGDEQSCREIIAGLVHSTPVQVIAGGERRQDSVRIGLAAVLPEMDLVLIHDAARPFITAPQIAAALAQWGGKQAATMAVAVKDTIAMVAGTGIIERTLERQKLYMIQTPQIFSRELILRAHRQALADGFSGTDDASLVERLGVPVAVIPGSYENIKITTPEDLVLAETILAKRKARQCESA